MDTSALGRVLLGEPDAGAVLDALERFDGWLASEMLRVELRRLALRSDCLGDADRLLEGTALVPVDGGVLRAAETIEPRGVATLDAIHLATAVKLRDADLIAAMVTYDTRLAAGARHHGLDVLAPGRSG